MIAPPGDVRNIAATSYRRARTPCRTGGASANGGWSEADRSVRAGSFDVARALPLALTRPAQAGASTTAQGERYAQGDVGYSGFRGSVRLRRRVRRVAGETPRGQRNGEVDRREEPHGRRRHGKRDGNVQA